MTIPVLKPDILRRVVEFALESCIVSGDDAATQLEKQGYLANLILVSKVFKEICTPQLYRDCLVSDANKLLYGPRRGIDSETPELLSKIKTLRIYHSNTRKGASYADLVSGKCRWQDIGCSREIIPKISAEWVDITALEYHQDEIAGNRFQQGPRLRAGIFGSLERICMTTTEDQSWGTHLQHHTVDQYFGHAWLPTALLNLPTVQHYCQSSMLGPLAIPNMGYRPTYPPKIVTFTILIHTGFGIPTNDPQSCSDQSTDLCPQTPSSFTFPVKEI